MRRMKLLTLLSFCAAVLAAECRAAEPPAIPAGIPSSAVKAADGYHYTDGQGRQWIYRPTPFGVARIPAAAAAPAKSPVPAENLRATDHGDSVSFERPGPFGVFRWERKKSEMDAAERAAWERQTDAGKTGRN